MNKIDQYSLPEGYARLEFPTNMSRESFDEFAQWLELILRRERRKVRESEAKEPAQ